MNLPPGMTKTDWQYVDGELHHIMCPVHEEAVCECLFAIEEKGAPVCAACYNDRTGKVVHSSRCESLTCRLVCECDRIRDDLAADVADEKLHRGR